ncbi:uncharacterized protein K460DRAFT_365507 [Cucurbitaria berberidis CBS 394.84]|uniref:SCP domain-containing protein n=1 Tax=Cucurbitaria berberidis CBS 394.84 TaxID=1168544 RepID=A0A9P4GFK4_9PLEO|nr:uncharacterized protein K460DRAFT_365507 [Cucurbitaria berberidis CBS 394.84]KAF1844561.1 hypothetical protein K460DRAFT_365507 [Cucurbitaria berberidis CBS 394.84]
MRTSFALAALAGSALAAPHVHRHQKKAAEYVNDVHVVVETQLATVYVTEGYEEAEPTPAPEPVYDAPVVTTIVYEEPAPEPTTYEAAPPAPPAPTSVKYEAPSSKAPPPAPPAPTTTQAPAPTYEAPAPAPTPTKPATPVGDDQGCKGVIDSWRAKLGLKPLEYDEKLRANARDVVKSGNGQMVHKLNPGTFGQVLAPGKADEFEHVFVGGWLCEIPTLPGLDGVCAKQSQGWSYEGQTGHADILTSTNYSKIGCEIDAGIWCCDLA